ncbi:Ig heavy chain Mem5-like [Colius striatus]|uniref:Ig heavy chain Mem5-like n=1 Tax=Colius striatus TaxID=57412 RepID=UPI002B1E15FF|nr:Ig heavy chain Mem5-like [Colius striatus]
MAAGPGPWLLGLGLALGPAGVWAQLRLLEAGGGQRAPGDSVLLSCRGHGPDFGTSTVRWYRQAPGGSLEWVSLIHFDSSLIRYGAAVDGRATVSRDNSRSEASLSLRALSPGDSARYFCAVPTHSWDKLVFGSGTTFTVEPGNISHSDPQVIVMRSKNLEEDGNTRKAACLARKFYTKNILLEVSSTEVRYEQSTPLLTSEGLYDALKVVNVTKGTEVSCTARYDGRDITANETLPEKEAEGSVGEAEGSVGEKVCNSTDTSAQDAEGEKSNTLAVAVLGLRVLLAKSLAFSTLMSIKLFVF